MKRNGFHSSLIVACVILVAAGCYAYKETMNSDLNEGYPDSFDAIRITLKDGTIIESPEYLHRMTTERIELISGVGRERSTQRVFKGIITGADLDSARMVMIGQSRSLVCWLRNKTSIGFQEGEYLHLTPEDQPGFWCGGKSFQSGRETQYRRAIAKDEIMNLEVDRFDFNRTALIFAPIPLYFLFVEVVKLVGRFGYHD